MVKVVITNNEGEIRELEGEFYSLLIGDKEQQSELTEGSINPIQFMKHMARHAANAVRLCFGVEAETPLGELLSKTFKAGFDVYFANEEDEPEIYQVRKVEK